MNGSHPHIFDPFEDRLARDIRNRLSTAMVEALLHGDRHAFTKCCRTWLQQELPPAHRRYIQSRSRVFKTLFGSFQATGDSDPLRLAAMLWNAGLFFEVHEVVENLWLPASGERRQALKGLVQAAGSYLHHEAGHTAAAVRLGRKAAAHLHGAAGALREIANIEALVAGLQSADPVAPRLIYDPEK